MTLRRTILVAGLAIGLVSVAAALWAMRHPAIAPIEPPSADQLDPDMIDRGDMLVALGGCANCHGAGPNRDLTGGTRLDTPFGALYSTNITPDRDTGIGTWSEEALRRAMRSGVDRDGNYLYPAFPYDHYTLVSDEDVSAIYAYLMSRPARAAPARPNELRFPFSIRLLLSGWHLLFLEEGPFVADPARDEDWNRGAYLVEGLGHCAACHTPRNAFGARDRARDYAGAMVEGWLSPALDETSPTPVPWTEDALINYFYDGWDEDHGIAAGPMREVVVNTSVLPESDVRAIVVYLLSLQEGRPGGEDAGEAAVAFARDVQFGAPSAPPPPSDAALSRGYAVFEKRCANCHRAGSEAVPLALATAVVGPNPHNFLRVALEGATPSENAYFVRPMPGFPMLSDEELADLASFARARFTRGPAWPGRDELLEEIAAIRAQRAR